MDSIFSELIELKSKLDKINELKAETEYASAEYDKLTDEAIDLVNQIGTLGNLLNIHCESAFKAYCKVTIPLRVARGGKFYYGEDK